MSSAEYMCILSRVLSVEPILLKKKKKNVKQAGN